MKLCNNCGKRHICKLDKSNVVTCWKYKDFEKELVWKVIQQEIVHEDNNTIAD